MGFKLTDFEKREKSLRASKFRASFCLDEEDAAYVNARGFEVIRTHATDFIQRRLAPAEPANDGKQTPRHGHPVFKAQHATATCCRACLKQWYGIEKGKALTKTEIRTIVESIYRWIERQLKSPAKCLPKKIQPKPLPVMI